MGEALKPPSPYWVSDEGDVTLHLGDCLDVLAAMETGSIDAVVTDPPYGLEFMGREWDGADGFRRSLNEADAGRDSVFGRTSRTSPEYQTGRFAGAVTDRDFKGFVLSQQRTRNVKCPDCGKWAYDHPGRLCECGGVRRAQVNVFQTWCEAWAAECLRVLKPGGHLLAFGGTRTWHRLTCAIEDAGFEIRDSTADLTGIAGPGLLWLYGCLTADAEILTECGWKPGIEVSPGERVAQWDHATGRVSLAPVQEVFRAPWDGPLRVLRNADTDQLLTPNHRVYHQPRQRQMTGGVRRAWYDDRWEVGEAGSLSMWNPVRLPIAGEHDGPGIGGEDYAALLGWVWTEGGFDLSGSGVRIYQSSVNADKVAEIAALMDRLGPHKRYDYQRTYTRRNGQSHPHVNTTWFFTGDLAARVRADLPGKRPTYGLLWRMTGAEKRALLRAAMLGDGSGFGTRSEQFYQKYEDDLTWFQTLLALVGRSGKVAMRSNRPGGSVTLRRRGTTELQARHLRDNAEHYTGEVWCVRVPTGAFIARRNGRVFITGNSGFPKSLDVSKAIDKHLGATRPVVETIPDRWAGKGDVLQRAAQDVRPEAHITSSATAAAAAAEGWGTALKPSWEPIVVARKPLAGTVAQNVLQHGTGALNVDGCRVGGAWVNPSSGQGAGRETANADGPAYGKGLGGVVADAHPAGRWPPNVVLGSAAAEELDRQSGVLTSGANPTRRGSDKFRDAYGDFAGQEECTPHRGTDSGGASRFFPVFKYEAKAAAHERPRLEDGTAHPTVKPVDLMAWLVRLVTPPGGLVLDPFAGSGTTAEACIVEGFRCVLIEQDLKSAELIKTRLSKPIQPVMLTVDDSAQPARPHPVAASRPKPPPEAHPSLFEDQEAS